MVKKGLVLVGLISLLLVGCGNKNTLTVKKFKDALGQDVVETTYELSDSGMYHKSIADDSKSKSELAKAQAKEIREVDISSQSTDAQALLNRDKIENINALKVAPYSGEKPTEWTDVGKTAVAAIPGVAKEGVKGAAILEAGRTIRSLTSKPTVEVNGDGNSIRQQQSDDDQTQVVTGNGEGEVRGAPQTRGGEGATGSEEGISGVDEGCTEDAPIMYNGTCYSKESVEERGFPVE